MLQQIGDALKGRTGHKWITYAVLGALSMVFAAWGAYGIVTLSVGNANSAAGSPGYRPGMLGTNSHCQRARPVLPLTRLIFVVPPCSIQPKLRHRFICARPAWTISSSPRR